MKGKVGTNTSTVIHTGKREKVKGKCKSCQEWRGNVCHLGRKPNPNNGCKWYASKNDYNVGSRKEKNRAKELNSVSKSKRKARANYNSGFGSVEVKTVDLSKYRAYKW